MAAKSLKDKGENWYRASVYEIESTDNIDNTQITVTLFISQLILNFVKKKDFCSTGALH